jgi:hypothetical protein
MSFCYCDAVRLTYAYRRHAHNSDRNAEKLDIGVGQHMHLQQFSTRPSTSAKLQSICNLLVLGSTYIAFYGQSGLLLKFFQTTHYGNQ